ncbi:MAG: aryl-sulfate sulfotransferase [Ignavibacteriales bacterium]|nr:aryl-sulfate sulfotransferase [Ignavibacteriales bacterium]
MKSRIGFLFVCMILLTKPGLSQSQTVGLFLNTPASYDGYTLFSPMNYVKSYLINNAGSKVHTWTSAETPALSTYLLDNGNLLRTEKLENNYFVSGGSGGRIKILNWDSRVVWNYIYSSDSYQLHHDARMLPNGNILMIAWEKKSASEAIAAGRNPSLLLENELWPDHLIEVKPTDSISGTIVWQWRVWDHVIQDFDSSKQNYGVVKDHPELINLNFFGLPGGPADWNHVNAVDYNQSLDQILISSNAFKEIWIIDHSTTTAQAAGHTGGKSGRGGDILYRWGNPRAYKKGTTADQKLFGVHDAKWIKAVHRGGGNIIMFNNGQGRTGGNYSSIEEIKPPVDSTGKYSLSASGFYGPDQTVWTYTAQPPKSLFAQNISGATRMANGNTLICDGPKGTFFEVDPNDSLVWKYISPVTSTGAIIQYQQMSLEANIVYNISRYPSDFPGFAGKDLKPTGPIELYPSGVERGENQLALNYGLSQNYPNPFNPSTTLSYSLPTDSRVKIEIFNLLGQQIAELANGEQSAGWHRLEWNVSGAASGIFIYRMTAVPTNDPHKRFVQAKKMMLLR